VVKPGKKDRGDGGSAATEGVAAAAPVSGGKGKAEEQEDRTVCMRCDEKTDQDRMLLCDVCDSPWREWLIIFSPPFALLLACLCIHSFSLLCLIAPRIADLLAPSLLSRPSAPPPPIR
jgi:hypothetical protein